MDESCYLEFFHRFVGEEFPICFTRTSFWGASLSWVPAYLLIKPLSVITRYPFTDWALPIVGILSYLQWCASLFLMDKILVRASQDQQVPEPSCLWTLALLLCVPATKYAFHFNFMTHSAEVLMIVFLFFFLQRGKIGWMMLFVVWLLVTRLNDVFVLLIPFAVVLERASTLSRKTVWALSAGSVLVVSVGSVVLYRAAFVNGYVGFFLPDVIKAIQLTGLREFFFNHSYGAFWHDVPWLFLLGSFSIRFLKINWIARAVLIWMVGVLILSTSARILGGNSEERFLIGSYLAAIFVTIGELPKMPNWYQKFFHRLVFPWAIWHSYYYYVTHPSNLKFVFEKTGIRDFYPLSALGLLAYPWQIIKSGLALSPLGFLAFSWAPDLSIFSQLSAYRQDTLKGPALFILTLSTLLMSIAVFGILVSRLRRRFFAKKISSAIS